MSFKKYFYLPLILTSLMIPSEQSFAGIGWVKCFFTASILCGELPPDAAPPCFAAAAVLCVGTCFSPDTTAVVKRKGTPSQINIGEVKAGDHVLTLKEGKPLWTEVLRNIKTEGSFEFLRIAAQNLMNTTDTKTLEVTPEHGLVFSHGQNSKTINRAMYTQIGDLFLDAENREFTVTSVNKEVFDAKYTLETAEGTVLASNLLVTTLCNEEVAGGERLFEPTLKDWQTRHARP